MKILYYVPDLGVCNGVSSYSMNYYRILKNKIEFDFLLTSDVETPYYEEIKSNGNKIFHMPNTKNIFKINSFLDEVFKNGNYDILHCHVINRGAVVLKRAKKYGVDVRILHSHTTQNGDTMLKRIIRYPFKVAALKFATYFFACSKMAGDYLFKKKQYKIINNAVLLNDSDDLREKNDCFTFGTIGRFTLQKNPFFIIDILNGLKKDSFEYKFLWIGSGELFEEIKTKALNLGLADNIVFVGNTTNVFSYYKKMDLFILPSLYEGLPVVGIEAQTVGVPCLFSNKISDEILINDNVKSLNIDSVDVWIKEIENKSKENDSLLLENKAKEKYDLVLNAKALYSSYVELLKKSKRGE